jgi:DNA-binding transcriptional MerR regulator
MITLKLEEFIDNRSLDKLAELHGVLTEERLSVKDTEVSYREINHWDTMGLIRFKRRSKDGNRKFNFVDFIWIKLVAELRSFGVSIPVIEKIAADVYEPLPMSELMEGLASNLDTLNILEDDENKKGFIEFLKSGEYKNADFSDFEFNYLQTLITEALVTRTPVSLIIFKDGQWFPFMKEKESTLPEELLERKEYSSHIRVSITEIIFKFIEKDYLRGYARELNVFTNQEEKLLDYIREGNYKRVLVLFKSKKKGSVEIKKSKQAAEEVMRILRENEYREFILTDKKDKEFRIRESSVFLDKQ